MEALKALVEVAKGLKHKKSIKSVKCPRCRSRKIHRLRFGWPGVTPAFYICDECGYAGPLVLEVEKGRG